MIIREFSYRGMDIDTLKKMSIEEFAKIVPSRQRRSLEKGQSESMKKILAKVRKNDKNIKTHARDVVVVPEMVGHSIKVYNGKEFVQVNIMPEMLGHLLGEFSLSRRRVTHNSPGIGSTKSSTSVSVR
jgi:small subunit ribosomal protein S19